jgi:hypothetical protein
MNQPEFFVTPGYGEYMLNKLHYSQAVKIGDRVETSGQGGWDDNLQIPESLADGIAQAFRNMEHRANLGDCWCGLGACGSRQFLPCWRVSPRGER